MYFTSLKLTQFRNYASLESDFCPGINALTGNNGEGKTNVLEALHYLAMTRGFQRRGESYALMENAPYFTVEGSFQEGENTLRIQCSYMPPKGKTMLINRQTVKKMSDHIGTIPIVAVLPNDTQLIHGSPSVRRKFMDAFISQYDRSYLEALLRYEKALDQRNALLNLFMERKTWDEEQLTLWDNLLIQTGIVLHSARREFLSNFEAVFLKYFHLIVSDKETPEIELKSDLVNNTVEEWQQLFQASRQKDRFSQRTSTGVHREDLTFTINGQGVKHFGSQGQQKTFVTALKFTQYEMLQRLSGKAPLLLLDDIFDKLDIHRLRSIAAILHEQVKGQVFITDTSLERTRKVFSGFSGKEVKYFAVSEGSVSELPKA